MVLTLDDGPQPLRWIGSRVVPAAGALAPVCIRAGTFGDHGKLVVSPQHRILLRDSLAELMFGEAEVLVAAKDLVNDRSVRRVVGGDVEYIHLLFDRHQIVLSRGWRRKVSTPGRRPCRICRRRRATSCSRCSRCWTGNGEGYGPPARPPLRSFEARALIAAPRQERAA